MADSTRATNTTLDPWRPGDSTQLVILLVSLTGVGVALGTLDAVVVAYAEGRRVPRGAPALLAPHAFRALVYGAVRHWTLPPRGGLCC
ncbi:hypothetical protein ACFXDH_45850 [Streptomyces sp. NPDC059467]|uniref:hypothetical protein n=1 Tax=Streptomyces sp. NPDC059467 TaxID=3346844 RepID=UPI0036998E79